MIGVIGGLGPYAGLEFVKRIFDNTPAKKDSDHLPVILFSDPTVPDRTAFLLGQEKENPAVKLISIADKLLNAGATVLCIPCNTAHEESIFGPVREFVERKSQARLLHLIEEVKNDLECKNVLRAGLLATLGTYRTHSYKKVFEESKVALVYPDDEVQQDVHRTIYDKSFGIKAESSPVTAEARNMLGQAAGSLKEKRCDALILGCTELPLALSVECELEGMTIVDPLSVLARAAITNLGAPRR